MAAERSPAFALIEARHADNLTEAVRTLNMNVTHLIEHEQKQLAHGREHLAAMREQTTAMRELAALLRATAKRETVHADADHDRIRHGSAPKAIPARRKVPR